MGELSEAKRKELETRAALGPRLGRAPKGGHRVTLPPRRPQYTGAPAGAIVHPGGSNRAA